MYNLNKFISILYISKNNSFSISIFTKLFCIIGNTDIVCRSGLGLKAYFYISEVVSFLESFGLVD